MKYGPRQHAACPTQCVDLNDSRKALTHYAKRSSVSCDYLFHKGKAFPSELPLSLKCGHRVCAASVSVQQFLVPVLRQRMTQKLRLFIPSTALNSSTKGLPSARDRAPCHVDRLDALANCHVDPRPWKTSAPRDHITPVRTRHCTAQGPGHRNRTAR